MNKPDDKGFLEIWLSYSLLLKECKHNQAADDYIKIMDLFATTSHDCLCQKMSNKFRGFASWI